MGQKKDPYRVSESQLHNIVRKSIAKVLNESQTVTVGEYDIKFDDDNKTILSVNGWSVRDQQAAIKTMGEDVYQQALQHLNGGYINEAYNMNQYTNLAGQANGAMNTFGGRIKGLFNPEWKKRKERQEKLFGNFGDGNYNVKGDGYSADNRPNSTYQHDYFSNRYNHNQKGDSPYKITRGQWNKLNAFDYQHGPHDGEAISRKDFNDNYTWQSREQPGISGADDVSMENLSLNRAYQQGRNAAMGKYKKGTKTIGPKGYRLDGTGTKNGAFQHYGEEEN